MTLLDNIGNARGDISLRNSGNYKPSIKCRNAHKTSSYRNKVHISTCEKHHFLAYQNKTVVYPATLLSSICKIHIMESFPSGSVSVGFLALRLVCRCTSLSWDGSQTGKDYVAQPYVHIPRNSLFSKTHFSTTCSREVIYQRRTSTRRKRANKNVRTSTNVISLTYTSGKGGNFYTNLRKRKCLV